MLINADPSLPASMHPEEAEWVASPAAGVTRLMLERDGDEVARATTIVRFEPESSFDAHVHDAGEEYLVLAGTFSDEDGDHVAGTYVRNPPGSHHAPFTKEGATLFVKLRQFRDGDGVQVVTDTTRAVWTRMTAGYELLPLHAFAGERTALLRWDETASGPVPDVAEGIELLVLKGAVDDGARRYPEGSWLRRPPGGAGTLTAHGATVLVKTGHLGPR